MRAACLLLAGLSAACSKQPHSIQIKLPTEAYQAGHVAPPPPVLRQQGATLALRASAFDGAGAYMGPAQVQWTSSDPKTLSVDAAGVVTAQRSGTAQITATGTTAAGLSYTLTMQARIVGSVRILPPTAEFRRLRLGEKLILHAEVLDDRGQPIPDAKVFWSKADHGVWLAQNGEISGAAIGETSVVAESEGKSAQIAFDVVE